MDLKLHDVAIYRRDGSLLFFKSLFEIAAGTRCLLEGPSGSGKSTLLQLLSGLFTPDEGSVYWDNENTRFLTAASRCKIRRDKFSIVFQAFNLLSHLTSLENVLLSRRCSKKEAMQALDLVGMGQRAHDLCGQLSQGEEQRVAVARSVAAKPQVLLADEPTSALDDDSSKLAVSALFSLSSSTTLVVVSHDLRLRSSFSQKYSWQDWRDNK